MTILMSFAVATSAFADNKAILNNEAKYKADVELIKSKITSVQEDTIVYDSIMNSRINQIQAYEQMCNNSSGQLMAANVIDPKLSCRASLLGGAGVAQLAGWKHTGNLLTHSLQNNPSTITANVGNALSTDVQNSKEMKNIINSFKKKLTSSISYYSENGSVSLTNDKDLYLALNKVSYLIAAEKVGSTWTIYTWVNDTYNFEYWNFSSAHSDFVTIVNNYAAFCQATGAVVPYSINIYFQDTK
ncbi:hypothetical protein EIM92_01265 [Paenibacillus lentus]|uniref:Uncharacterized protein n=2 Tax=Paenibacillus lentus TaxID=1338368 RepID=A0A3Q8S3G0_9BACL|nr:hypothetical protein EIM92_01265 [Paenibacillus lentus]